jgi:hypothetical protein
VKTFTKRQIEANRKAWIKALRSGKFKQTTCCLKDEYGHCCLGVACEVLRQRGAIEQFDPHAGALPEDARRALGLRTSGGNFTTPVEAKNNYGSPDSYFALYSLNDGLRWSFKKIATLIEKGRKGLFLEASK